MHIDTLPAFYAWNMDYPGFQGMKLEPTPPEALYLRAGRFARPGESGARQRRPVARSTSRTAMRRSPACSCDRLIPDAVPGPHAGRRRHRSRGLRDARSRGQSDAHSLEQHRRQRRARRRSCGPRREVTVTYVKRRQDLPRARRHRRDGVLELHDSVSLSGACRNDRRRRSPTASRRRSSTPASSFATGRRSPGSASQNITRTRRIPLRRAAAEPVTHRRVPRRRARRRSRRSCTS